MAERVIVWRSGLSLMGQHDLNVPLVSPILDWTWDGLLFYMG